MIGLPKSDAFKQTYAAIAGNRAESGFFAALHIDSECEFLQASGLYNTALLSLVNLELTNTFWYE